MDYDAQAMIEIRNLLATCTQAGDARKPDAYAGCFAVDGVLALAQPIEGRDSIRAWMTAPSVIPLPQTQTPGFVSHHLTTSRITMAGHQAASVRTYWLVITAAGLDHSGYYDDRLVRVDGAWLIAHRKPRTLWVSPSSLLAGAG